MQVQLTVSFQIAAEALKVTPSSVTITGTQGTALSTGTVAEIQFGTAPYTASVDPSSPSQLPNGVLAEIDANGNVSFTGTPTSAGTGTVVLDINDSASA